MVQVSQHTLGAKGEQPSGPLRQPSQKLVESRLLRPRHPIHHKGPPPQRVGGPGPQEKNPAPLSPPPSIPSSSYPGPDWQRGPGGDRPPRRSPPPPPPPPPVTRRPAAGQPPGAAPSATSAGTTPFTPAAMAPQTALRSGFLGAGLWAGRQQARDAGRPERAAPVQAFFKRAEKAVKKAAPPQLKSAAKQATKKVQAPVKKAKKAEPTPVKKAQKQVAKATSQVKKAASGKKTKGWLGSAGDLELDKWYGACGPWARAAPGLPHLALALLRIGALIVIVLPAIHFGKGPCRSMLVAHGLVVQRHGNCLLKGLTLLQPIKGFVLDVGLRICRCLICAAACRSLAEPLLAKWPAGPHRRPSLPQRHPGGRVRAHHPEDLYYELHYFSMPYLPLPY